MHLSHARPTFDRIVKLLVVASLLVAVLCFGEERVECERAASGVAPVCALVHTGLATGGRQPMGPGALEATRVAYDDGPEPTVSVRTKGAVTNYPMPRGAEGLVAAYDAFLASDEARVRLHLRWDGVAAFIGLLVAGTLCLGLAFSPGPTRFVVDRDSGALKVRRTFRIGRSYATHHTTAGFVGVRTESGEDDATVVVLVTKAGETRLDTVANLGDGAKQARRAALELETALREAGARRQGRD